MTSRIVDVRMTIDYIIYYKICYHRSCNLLHIPLSVFALMELSYSMSVDCCDDQ